MKNIWLLTTLNIKRNKLFLFISILGGLILCFFLYAMGNLSTDVKLGKIKIGVIDQDQSILSADFKSCLTEDLNYELMENLSYDELSTELIEKQISAIIEIPGGFYGSVASGNMQEITITTLDDYENSAFLEANLNSYLNSIRILSDSAAKAPSVFEQLLADYDKEEIKLTQTAAQTLDMKLLRQKEGFSNSIGFFLMLVFGLSIVISFIVLDDRVLGVFRRVRISPVKPVQYILGTGIFGLGLCLIEVLIYCGYIGIADYHIGFNLGLLVFLMTLFSLFTTCFAIAIALALRTKGAITAVSIGFSTIGCILGGAYFPLDFAPKSLQNLAKILPQYWFMDILRTVQADNTANITPNIIILVLFTLLTFLIGAVLFSQNYKSN